MTGLLLVAALAATDPGPEQWMALGREFLENRAYREALRAYDAAAETSNGPCSPCDLGATRALLGLGRGDDAVERARRTVEHAGDEATAARLLLGRALLGRAGADVETLREAEALFRDLRADKYPEAGLWLGETLTRRGADDDARTVLRDYLESEPDAAGRARARQLIALPHCGRESCLPAFEIEGLDGTLWNNERLAGRVVLLDFWASWCAPCVEAVPALKSLAADRADRPFLLLSLSADSDPEALAGFLDEHGLAWPQIRDDDGSTIVGRFGVRTYPTYVIVDHDGIVRGQYVTGALENGEIARKIDELLGQR